MSVFKSSNHIPSLSEIDATTNNTFTAQVNTSGEPIKAYKLTIMSGDASETVYDGAIQNLTTPVKNKGILEIPNINTTTIPNLVNGKDYQWGVRVYNQASTGTAQPNTLICDGYLTGSTKYVTWMELEDHGEGGINKDVADNLVYDRYIEYSAASADELLIGAHESSDKEKPESTEYPFVQRKKIDWVEKELGQDKQYIKIETDESFDYDYPDGHAFSIYKCASDHTVTSAFADPNTNINVSDYIVLYNNTADALAAFNAGDNPDEIKSNITPAATKRKIVGYSSDTGEIRVYDAWESAPTNGMVYRIFEYDSSTETYTELLSSDLLYKVKTGSKYYSQNAPQNTPYYSATISSNGGNKKYYTLSGTTLTEAGFLTADTQGTINGYYTIGSTSTLCSDITLTTITAADGITLYDTTVGMVDYFSDPSLSNKVGTLTAASTDCTYCSEAVSTIYDTTEGKTYYVATLSTLGTLLSTDADRVCTKITDTYSKITFTRDSENKEAYVKTSALTTTSNNYLAPTDAQVGTLSAESGCTFKSDKYSTVIVDAKTYQIQSILGGIVGEADNYIASNVSSNGGTITVSGNACKVIFASLQSYIGETVLGNPFEAQVIGGRPITSEYYISLSNKWDTTTKRLFIQPNINIKTDSTLYNEIVFTSNSARVNIVKQTKLNPSQGNKEVDITFEKLDDTQWLLKGNAITLEGTTPVPTTDGHIIPQTDYKVYSDFMDSSPLNLFYARSSIAVTLQAGEYQESGTITYQAMQSTYAYRDIAFKTADIDPWTFPQVKYYNYTLYDGSGNTITTSEDYYTTDLSWYFRGFETGKSYTVKLTIVDEYDKSVEVSATFSISYTTEQSIIPINLSYDCHEHAMALETINVLEAVSTDNTSASQTTVTTSNLTSDTEGIYLEIPESKTLNYTETTKEDAIVIPSECTLLTQFQITSQFIDNIPNAASSSGTGGSYSKVLSLEHVLDDSTTEYYTLVLTNIFPYYYNETTHQYCANQNIGRFQLYKGTDFDNAIACFDGADYWSIGDNCGAKYVSPKNLRFVLQSDAVYVICNTELPGSPETGKKYVLLNTNLTHDAGIYTWNGSTFVMDYSEEFLIVSSDTQLPGGTQPEGFITNSISGVYDDTTGTYSWVNTEGTTGPNSLYIVNPNSSGDVAKEAFNDAWFTLYLVITDSGVSGTITYKEGGRN